MTLEKGTDPVRAERAPVWDRVSQAIFDVAILGGGITGACLYDQLCRHGYRVLLLDRGDFASGTSQASGMVIWGGLLYLRNLDVWTVLRLSRDREELLRSKRAWVTPRSFRFIPSSQSAWGKTLVHAALYFYWALGLFHRFRPRSEQRFEEASLLAEAPSQGSLLQEEAMLKVSDCRFVLQWITPHRAEQHVPLNYACVAGGRFVPGDGLWYLDVADALGDRAVTLRARFVVNATGIWTDDVNRLFGISTPYKHVFSKGVYLGLRRFEEHRDPLLLEMEEYRDIVTLIPWGPLSLWGPTETMVQGVEEGFTPSPDDVRFLLHLGEKKLRHAMPRSDIISLRCGIRPLAVNRSDAEPGYPLDVSRADKIWDDPRVPWISVYGGKLTSCISLARSLAARLALRAGPGNPSASSTPEQAPEPARDSFPGLSEPIPSLDWCIRHEFCCTLDDYLRRRTNIAQWVNREGLGATGENLPLLRRWALALAGGSESSADRTLDAYEAEVRRRHDRILERI